MVCITRIIIEESYQTGVEDERERIRQAIEELIIAAKCKSIPDNDAVKAYDKVLKILETLKRL